MQNSRNLNLLSTLGFVSLSAILMLQLGPAAAHESWDGKASQPAVDEVRGVTKGQVGQNTSDDDDLLADDDDDLLADDDDDLLADDDEDFLADDDEDLLADDDDLLSDDDDLLITDDESDTEETVADEETPEETDVAVDAYAAHEQLFIDSIYPSANDCASCHEKQYNEWSVSQHAYAQLSPVFMAFQTTINSKTSGTNGDFCIRCHTQVGMNLGESIYISNLDRPATSREGITCIVCHRVPQKYGKASGRLALKEGDLFDPVFGPSGNDELQRNRFLL